MSRRLDSETGDVRTRAARGGTTSGRRAAAKFRRRDKPAATARAPPEPGAKAEIEGNLDEALEATFPASDPVAITRVDS